MKARLGIGSSLVLLCAFLGVLASSASSWPVVTAPSAAALLGGNECFGIVHHDSSGLWIACENPCAAGCTVIVRHPTPGIDIGSCGCDGVSSDCCRMELWFYEGSPTAPGTNGKCSATQSGCPSGVVCDGDSFEFPDDTIIYYATCL